MAIADQEPSRELQSQVESYHKFLSDFAHRDLVLLTKRGLARLAACGGLPTGNPPTGYRISYVTIGDFKSGRQARRGRKPEPDPEMAPLVAKAFEMRANNESVSAIAAATGLFAAHSSAWARMFRNHA